MPNRKNKTPFTGCRVLDGSKSENDWDGYLPSSDLIRVANPKKGFVVTANNRVSPEHSKLDSGATLTSTPRAQRLTELIQKNIDEGVKFDIDTILKIQNDTVDVVARELTPVISRIAHKQLEKITDDEELRKASEMLKLLEAWNGDMSEESVGATVYSVWVYKLYLHLFSDVISDEDTKLQIVANYPFMDFYQRLVREIEINPDSQRLNHLCKDSKASFQGTQTCAFMIVKSLADAYDFLETELSPNIQDWKWKNIHVNEYPNMPWSLSPLKFLFHRESVVGGNGNTVKVSKYTYRKLHKTRRFKSNHSPNYKQVIQHGNSDLDKAMVYSHDGGQNGNLFAGHYFDFNANHL